VQCLRGLNVKKNNIGFTLIELSIVMVIIGLLIGGILVGKDLISAAGTRAVISQINKYDAAIYYFKGKYGFLPGDYPQATTYLSPITTNGNGDNQIYLSNYSLPIPFCQMGCCPGGNCMLNPTNVGSTSELPLFWQHLSLAGLIEGNFIGATALVVLGSNYPAIAAGANGIVAMSTFFTRF
jgi:prepilin-type N-terminal cleavage/methylation domain-containing protein